MSELFNLAGLSFLGVLTITFGGAFIAVGARNIFHNVLGLAISLVRGRGNLRISQQSFSGHDGNSHIRGGYLYRHLFRHYALRTALFTAAPA